MSTPIEKVSIIISKGSFEGAYPGLILANGARMEGIEANVFFTFFGLDVINPARNAHLQVATVGNPGLPADPSWAGQSAEAIRPPRCPGPCRAAFP